jgi:hypothetical protein
MFGANKSVAVQDPSYPVYVDTTVMLGNTGGHNGTGFDGVEYMLCTPENNFFPDLSKVGGGKGYEQQQQQQQQRQQRQQRDNTQLPATAATAATRGAGARAAAGVQLYAAPLLHGQGASMCLMKAEVSSWYQHAQGERKNAGLSFVTWQCVPFGSTMLLMGHGRWPLDPAAPAARPFPPTVVHQLTPCLHTHSTHTTRPPPLLLLPPDQAHGHHLLLLPQQPHGGGRHPEAAGGAGGVCQEEQEPAGV